MVQDPCCTVIALARIVLMCSFKVVSRSRLCQRLEERELRSLEGHPPLADLRQVHFSLQPQASCKRAILERSDPLTPLRLASACTVIALKLTEGETLPQESSGFF
jgi:hypothetical protein